MMNIQTIGFVACFVGAMVPAVVISLFGVSSQDAMSIGERFHAQTSHSRRGSPAEESRRQIVRPPTFKEYPGVRLIELAPPAHRGVRVEEAIARRRSVRSYSTKSMTRAELSQLLYAAQGVTSERSGIQLRTAPSAGALYPLEIYAVVNHVEGIPKGLYHYNVRRHGLETIREGDLSRQIRAAGLDQQSLGEADVVFVLTAIVDRARIKYRERAYRYVYMEAGHISQNIALQAVSLGLGSVCAGAFYDDEVNTLIGIDGFSEFSVYLHPVGTLE